jgi:hypothetical protein
MKLAGGGEPLLKSVPVHAIDLRQIEPSYKVRLPWVYRQRFLKRDGELWSTESKKSRALYAEAGDKTVIRGSHSFNVTSLDSKYDRELQSIFCPPYRWRYRNGLRRLIRVPITGCKYDTVYSNTPRKNAEIATFRAFAGSSIYRYMARATRRSRLLRRFAIWLPAHYQAAQAAAAPQSPIQT